MSTLKEFREFRERMNDRILGSGNLEIKRFFALDTRAFKSRVEQDVELAAKVGARGTPCFFINGRKLVGAQPADAFKAIIDEELAEARKLIAKGTPPEKIYDKLTATADSGAAKTPVRR